MSNHNNDYSCLLNVLPDIEESNPFPSSSTQTLWNNEYFQDFSFLHNSQEGNKLSKDTSDFTVSNVSDAHLHTSPLSAHISDPQNVPDNLLINNDDGKHNLPIAYNSQHVPTFTHHYDLDYHNSKKRLNDSHDLDNSSPSRALKRKKISSSHLNASPASIHQIPVVRDSPISQKRPADESRVRHNKMMRENRGRVNKKFNELSILLKSLEEPNCDYIPMKNKIKILERAICQYGQMEAKKEKYQIEYHFSPETSDQVKPEQLKVFSSIPSLKDACTLLLRNLCAINDWKYGEVWMKTPAKNGTTNYQLGEVHISKNNMPDTRNALQEFADTSRQQGIDEFLRNQSQYDHAVWIPNIGSSKNGSERAKDAKNAKISTAVVAPLSLNSDTDEPDVIIVLMHVDDELLSYPKKTRPYDPDTIISLLNLSSAIVLSRARVNA